jgi:[acyl-carrier-protein] S-malonyltransferase
MSELSQNTQPALACVFPGQGSQSVGMLAALGEEYACVKEVFEIGSGVLGYDAWSLAQDGPKEALGRTEVTQPLMLLAGVAVWRAWRTAGGPLPAYAAGHSLGEYTALVAAEALSLPDAVAIVQARAKLMQETVPEGQGAMAVFLGLVDEKVQEICAAVSPQHAVAPANYNSPGQVVVGGYKTAVDEAAELAKSQGCKRVVPVAMSVPSHCRLMEPAAERLAPLLEKLSLQTPNFPIVNNLTATAELDVGKIRSALRAQIYNPVLWTQVIQNLINTGCHHLVELGPGKVLTGLGKRIDRSQKYSGVENPDELNSVLESIRAQDSLVV